MKKETWLFKLYIGILLAVFGLIVLHAPLTVYFGTIFPDFDLLLKSWKEILLIVAMPIGIYLAVQSGVAKKMKKDYLFWAILAYALLHLLLLFIFMPSLQQLLAGLAIDLRYILFFTLVFIALSIRPHYRKTFLMVGLTGTLFIISFALLQIFVLPPDILSHIGYGKDTIEPYLTIDKNPDFIRINATLRGPNPLGAYALIILSVIAAWLVAKKHTIKEKQTIILLSFFALAGVIVLWASYSRSALVATVLSLGIVTLVVFAKKIKIGWWVGAVVLLILFSGFLYSQKDSHFVQHVLLHNNPTSGSARDSNEEHTASLETGTERILTQPIGAGVGSTGSASLFSDEPIIIENQYLFIAHESGWLGLALFIYIFTTILWRSWRKRADWLALGVFASGVGLACIGFLLPVWVDDTVSIVWWGLAAIALATGGNYGKRKQTK